MNPQYSQLFGPYADGHWLHGMRPERRFALLLVLQPLLASCGDGGNQRFNSVAQLSTPGLNDGRCCRRGVHETAIHGRRGRAFSV